jgi:DNA-binding transcriptional LysR family regulator
MLNLERLRALNAVARHGSITGAAEGLHLTTSAVSQQLAKLEREAGQQLLSRHGRGIRLTDAGRLLAEHAGQIIARVERAQSELEARRGEVVGELSLGLFPTAARGLAPQTLITLRDRHPRLCVRMHEMEPHEALTRVVRGDLDLAVVNDWANHRLVLPDDLVRASLLDDPTDIAVPADHSHADRPEIELRDLANDGWAVWPEGQYCHAWLMQTLRAAGVEPRVLHIAGEHQTQLMLVAAGLVVAVTPRLGRGPVPDGVRVVRVRNPLQRHVFAVWRSDADRRPAIRAAVDALRHAAERTDETAEQPLKAGERAPSDDARGPASAAS